MMKKIEYKKIIFLILVMALSVIFMALFLYTRGRTEAVQELEISTGTMNNTLAYDPENEISLVGTNSDNMIYAFKDGSRIWSAEAKGAFSKIVVAPKKGLAVAGNQDGNVYVYNLKDGTLLQTISVKRRVVSIDVNNSEDKIAVSTLTGTSKANLYIFDFKGTALTSVESKVKISGVCFSGDKAFVAGNNRGDIIQYDLKGNELGSVSTNYSIIQFYRNGKEVAAVCKDGSYYFVDENMKIVRQGKIDNTVQAIPESIGTDQNGNYVAVGTQEGYIFVLDADDKPVYTAEEGKSITSFSADGSNILFTGNGDFVKKINTEGISGITWNRKVSRISLIFMIIGLAFTGVLVLIIIPGVSRRLKRLGKEMWKARAAYFLLIPGLLLIWFFNYRGILTAFVRAFTNWSTKNNTLAEIQFIGFDNFKRMFTEGYFLTGMANLLLLLITGAVKVLTVPVICAWLCYSASGNRRKYIHRFLFVLPIVVPGVISAMVWLKIYDPNIGLLNEFLIKMGLSNLTRVWLGDSQTAIWAVIFMGFPFVNAMAFLVYYGGLLGIGKDVEESAVVDGANRWNIFWKIQIPLLRPQFRVMLTLTLIGTMQNFNEIYILTQGGPGKATYVPALELYFNVSQFGRYGYACALGVVLFIMTMAITLLNLKLTKSKDV